MFSPRRFAGVLIAVAALACDDDFPAERDVPCEGLTCAPECGDGVRQLPEECDLGEENSDAGRCTLACLTNRCGDGKLRTGFEACDDGNLQSGDGCDANCSITACGNGVRSVDELCDDGNTIDGDGCNANCRPSACEEAANCSSFASQCSVGFCNPENGFCDGLAINEGRPCGAGCGGVGQCRDGACVGALGAVCDDGNPCTDDICQAGGCVHPFNEAPCNECGVCSQGACKRGSATACNDANPCTVDTCASDGSCGNVEDDGAECDDGLFCNGLDTCDQDACTIHAGDPCGGGTTCSENANRCE
jgi:cysteine-rich repeat protein